MVLQLTRKIGLSQKHVKGAFAKPLSSKLLSPSDGTSNWSMLGLEGILLMIYKQYIRLNSRIYKKVMAEQLSDEGKFNW